VHLFAVQVGGKDGEELMWIVHMWKFFVLILELC